jgi:hypothetical protein
MVAREIHRPGPTGLITTLTKGLTKEDNETRTISLYMNDSKEHTLRVIEAQALREGGLWAGEEVDPLPWHALYRTLPQKEVVVPFAPAVQRLLHAQDLPEDLTRLRRDFPRFLTLVKVVALLHHARREGREGRIVATLEDYALAYHLAARPLTRSVRNISPQALKVAAAVQEVVREKEDRAKGEGQEFWATPSEVARVLRWGKRTAYKWVDLAEEGGLIEVRTEGNRKRLYPVEDAPLEEAAFRLLPEPETLAQELGEELTYVHPVHGGWEKSVLSFPQTACTTPSKTEKTPSWTRKTNVHAMCTSVHARRRRAVWERKNPVHKEKYPFHRKNPRNVHAPCTPPVHARGGGRCSVHNPRAQNAANAVLDVRRNVHAIRPVLDGAPPGGVHIRAHSVHIGFCRPEGHYYPILGELCTHLGEERNTQRRTP